MFIRSWFRSSQAYMQCVSGRVRYHEDPTQPNPLTPLVLYVWGEIQNLYGSQEFKVPILSKRIEHEIEAVNGATERLQL